MSVIAAALKHMLASNMDHEAIVAAVADMEAAMPKDVQAERRRGIDRLRKQNNWASLRLAVFERDDFRCVYCGADVSADPQCDHVHPISRGGANAAENLVTACRHCNSSKGDKTPEEWRTL